MSEVPTWDVFAYFDADDGSKDEHRRNVPDWRLDDVIRWCRSRGYDNIYIHRDEETTVFERAKPIEGVVHRMGDERSAA